MLHIYQLEATKLVSDIAHLKEKIHHLRTTLSRVEPSILNQRNTFQQISSLEVNHTRWHGEEKIKMFAKYDIYLKKLQTYIVELEEQRELLHEELKRAEISLYNALQKQQYMQNKILSLKNN